MPAISPGPSCGGHHSEAHETGGGEDPSGALQGRVLGASRLAAAAAAASGSVASRGKLRVSGLNLFRKLLGEGVSHALHPPPPPQLPGEPLLLPNSSASTCFAGSGCEMLCAVLDGLDLTGQLSIKCLSDGRFCAACCAAAIVRYGATGPGLVAYEDLCKNHLTELGCVRNVIVGADGATKGVEHEDATQFLGFFMALIQEHIDLYHGGGSANMMLPMHKLGVRTCVTSCCGACGLTVLTEDPPTGGSMLMFKTPEHTGSIFNAARVFFEDAPTIRCCFSLTCNGAKTQHSVTTSLIGLPLHLRISASRHFGTASNDISYAPVHFPMVIMIEGKIYMRVAAALFVSGPHWVTLRTSSTTGESELVDDDSAAELSVYAAAAANATSASYVPAPLSQELLHKFLMADACVTESAVVLEARASAENANNEEERLKNLVDDRSIGGRQRLFAEVGLGGLHAIALT